MQGKSQKTINVYSLVVRRVSKYFYCSPDQMTPKQLEIYFGELVNTYSWNTVKIDQNGLKFFWRYVRSKPSRRDVVASQPNCRRRLTSSSLHGVPSGLPASKTIFP